MQEGSEYFYGQLLESQKDFARGMNGKTQGRYYNLLRCYRMKVQLPIYDDVLVHNIMEEEYGDELPRSTAADWLNRIPTLLESWDEIEKLLKEEHGVSYKEEEEKKYTLAEWKQLQRLEGFKLNVEYRTMMEKLNNPKLSGPELMKLTGATKSLINKINNHGLTMIDPEKQVQMIQLTEDIMLAGRTRLLREIEKMPVWKMTDLKALSGIIADVFNQHRLLNNESTSNVALGVGDIYEKILKKSQEAQLPEAEVRKLLDAEVGGDTAEVEPDIVREYKKSE